jgi:Tol biopolymer transport system component
MRQLLRDRAEDIPSFREMPPRLRTRARRRVALTFGAAFVAVAVLVVGAFAGVNAIRSAPVPADRPTPSPAPGLLRADGEVLSFTGVPSEAPGDLVAVNPQTGEERVLVEDLDLVYSARWSADGRWVAYATPAPEGIGLWVVNASQEPRQIATERLTQLAVDGSTWMWSSTGADLATLRWLDSGVTLSTIDPLTGETTDVGSIQGWGDDTSVPVWSPDGTRFVFGARGGALYSIDVRTGERSILVQLPGEDLDSIDTILWSPDGAHIAVMNDLVPGGGRLYVMDADGSNVRVLDDEYDPAGLSWSPDGTRLAYAGGSRPAGKVRIWVALMDGSAPDEIGSIPVASCEFVWLSPRFCEGNLTWSPDGSRIAFRTTDVYESVLVWAIDADGLGDAEPIDDLTYRSWDGGWYSW